MKYLCLLLFLWISVNGQAHAKDHCIRLENPHFQLIIDSYFSQNLDFNVLPDDDTIYLTYWGQNPKAEVNYDGKTLVVSHTDQDFERVHLQLGEKVKSIGFKIQPNPAQYDQAYIQQHSGKVSVETPQVYELVNIVLALSDYYHQSQYGTHDKGQYYAEVVSWFAPVKDHAIFSKLDDVDYYSFVENGPAYIFVGDEIKPSELYSGFRARDKIKDNIALLEDFAKSSDFTTFYKNHQAYYQDLHELFHLGSEPQKIWRWLETQFPARYHSYKVFFSPLGSGKHSARMFANNGLNESVMFISGPNRYDEGENSALISSLKLTRSFFTEIDHTYVNPVTDQYVDGINDALIDLQPWYKGGGYNKPYLVFNEYMTWSVYSLYAMENYSPEDYGFMRNYIEQFMIGKRGFYKFKQFNDELRRLYKTRSSKQKISDLYPAIIQWIKNSVDSA